MATPKENRQRLDAVDGLRGVAALAVAVSHNQVYFAPADKPFFTWAWACVDLFFLLSGLILTHVYEAGIRSGRVDFTAFLAHRVARLWPLHLFAVGVMVLLYFLQYVHFSTHGVHLHTERHVDSLIYTFFLNLVFLQYVGLYPIPNWDAAGWSLSPELALNFIWFYLIVRWRLRSSLLVAGVLACAVAQFTWGGAVNANLAGSYTVRTAISFGLGCLLYRHLVANEGLGQPSRWVGNALGLGAMALLLMVILNLAMWNLPEFNHWDFLCVLFIFPVLTYAALQEGTVLNAFFGSAPLTFLGYISYSVYLLHMPVGMICHNVFDNVFRGYLPRPWAGLIYLAATGVVAWLAYTFIENPSRRYLRGRLEAFFKKLCREPGE